MVGQRSSVNGEKRPSPILDRPGTSRDPKGDTPCIHLGPVQHAAKHDMNYPHHVAYNGGFQTGVRAPTGVLQWIVGGPQQKKSQ